MFKKTAIIAGIGLALSATAQADYRWELGAGYAAGNFDYKTKNSPLNINDDNDTDVIDLSGTYYLENVDTSKGPLGEAAFLDHASNITLAFTDGELDISKGSNKDGQTYSVDTRYVAEGPGWKLSGWLVDLGYERAEPGDADIDIWSLGIGKYITPNTTLVLGYQNDSVNNGGDVDSWGADVEHFFAFTNGDLKARAHGGKTVVSGLDDPTTWGLGATWYLNNNWGFGLDYGQDDVNGYETEAIHANVEWFITENFAVDLSYTDIQPDDIDIDAADGGGKLETEYDQVGISALYRF
jgi:hypothetical protein